MWFEKDIRKHFQIAIGCRFKQALYRCASSAAIVSLYITDRSLFKESGLIQSGIQVELYMQQSLCMIHMSFFVHELSLPKRGYVQHILGH